MTPAAGPVPADAPSRSKRVFWAITLIALLVRVAHLLAIRDAPFALLFMGDAESYDLWAADLAEGDWIGDEAFYQAPLYPYFLGTIYTLVGNHPMVIRIVQSVLGALGCGFVASAASKLLSARAGWAAGLLVALYAPGLFFDSLIQKTSLAFFLTAVLVWLVASAEAPRTSHDQRWVESTSTRVWLGVGLATGLLILTRENAAIFLPVLGLWAWRRSGGGSIDEGVPKRLVRSRSVRAAGLVLLGAFTILGPVALRNWVVSGEAHLTTSQFGPNFYMGNNPAATGVPQPLRIGRDNPRFERRDAVLIAERELRRDLSPGEVSAYWTNRTLDYIWSDPVDWSRLMVRKLFLFWNDLEISDTEDPYTYAEHSPVLRILRHVLRFGTLAVLGLFGAWLTRREQGLWMFRLLPLFYMASVLLFFIWARYRHPIVPFLAVFAGAAVDRLPAFVRGASPTRLVVAGVVIVAISVPIFWPTIPVDQQRAKTWTNVGAALEERAGSEHALPYYRRALELNPRSSTAHYYLGTALQRRGSLHEALSHYRQAVRIDPQRPEIHNNLGVALLAAGFREEAVRHFRRAVEIDPAHPDALTNLGALALGSGDFEEAERQYRRAIRADPSSGPARLRLGHLLVMRGAVSEAFEHYGIAARQGLRDELFEQLVPLAWRLAVHPDPSLRDPERALAVTRELLRIEDPSPPLLLRVHAAAQAGVGQFDQAVATASNALERLATESDSGQPSAALPHEAAEIPPLTVDPEAIREDLERYRRGQRAESGGM